MTKSNKELAIDVAIAVINNNPKFAYGPNNLNLSSSVSYDNIIGIIEGVNNTLNKIDADNAKNLNNK